MAVRVITAPPGAGKTFNMSRIALNLFNEKNTKLKRIFYKIIGKKYIFKNTIYSNYPILLYKSKKPILWIDGHGEEHYSKQIFSNKVKFTDMRLKYRFCEDASFFIDEIQYIYDSQEYSSFPDCIAHFFQVHRHLSYDYIYTNSQSLSRVIKKVLCISEEFWNVISLKFYFGIIGRVVFRVSYDMEDSKKSENVTEYYDDEVVKKWFINKKIFNSYDTKYLKALNDGLPLYDGGTWESLTVPKEEILGNFLITKQEKDELFKQEF